MVSGSFNFGTLFLILLGCAIVFIIVWKKFIKPAKVNFDSTICFTGGLGSGKTLNSVKHAKKYYRRVHLSWRFRNWVNGIKNKFKDEDEQIPYEEEPLFYSNIPVKIGRNRWCNRLTREHMIFKVRIPEKSVVFIDELPKFCSQHEWDSYDVQTVLDEWFTFFRHYIDGLFVCNAQSLDEVVAPIRRKLNAYYYCCDFTSILFVFYRVQIMRCRVGDVNVSLTSDYWDQNAKAHYGLLFPRSYDSRCYRHRYDKVQKRYDKAFDDACTNKVLRFLGHYQSVLDEKEEKHDC